MSPPLLVTGFGPYDGARNATEVLARSLVDDPLPGLEGTLEVQVLACVSADLPGFVHQLAERVAAGDGPRAWIQLGQAPGRNHVELERRAVNRLHFPIPDRAGVRHREAEVVPGGPPALPSGLPNLDRAREALRAAGIPARDSQDAGTYLCNQLFYLAAHHLGRALPSGFVHLPLLPVQVLEERPEAPFMPLGMTRDATRILALEVLEGLETPA